MMNKQDLIVDFHTHAFNDSLAQRVMQETAGHAEFIAHGDGTIAGLLTGMQAAGIDHSVIQPIATKPQQVRTINQWCQLVNQQQTHLTCFGALHPQLTNNELAEEVHWLHEQGFKGVKLHPEYQAFFPDDDRLACLYELLAKWQLILLIHSGRDLSFAGEIKASPKRLKAIYQGFPKLKLILAHLGGFQMWEDVTKELVGLPIWMDTAYCAGYVSHQLFAELVNAHGSEYFLLGSDSPWGKQQTHIEFIKQTPLNEQEKHRILGKNGLQLLTS